MDDKYYHNKEVWLEANGFTDGDVMSDAFDREFVYEIDEDGVKKKVYIEDVIT